MKTTLKILLSLTASISLVSITFLKADLIFNFSNSSDYKKLDYNKESIIYENQGASTKDISIEVMNNHKEIPFKILEDTSSSISGALLHRFQDGLFIVENNQTIINRHFVMTEMHKTFTTSVPAGGLIRVRHSCLDPNGEFLYKIIVIQ